MRFAAALLLFSAALFAQPKSPAALRDLLGQADGWPRVLIISTANGEPRKAVNEGLATQQMFGADVDAARSAIIDGSTLGYPRESFAQVPAGDYYCAGRAERLRNLSPRRRPHRQASHGSGRRPALESQARQPVQRAREDANRSRPRGATCDASSSPRPSRHRPPKDTKFIKHVRIQSKLLTAFWGRPMYLGAIVLLPDGFDEHPDAHYPGALFAGPLRRRRSARFRSTNRRRPADGGRGGRGGRGGGDYPLQALPGLDQRPAAAHADRPHAGCQSVLRRFLRGQFGQRRPLWRRAYSGACTRTSRSSSAASASRGRARVYGGSTGGWRALALQVLYPDFFNGAWVFCPDPIDFHAYAMVNLYKDDNAFWPKSQWKQRADPHGARSGRHDQLRYGRCHPLRTGARHARAARREQFDIWQAVYSPVGEDGYPALIIDPRTGAIDHKVAEYWKEHYDLDYIMQRDWKTLGPKLIGKLHFAVGELDTYYLERAVHLTQQFLDSTREPGKGPYADATFDFGPGRPHGYSGDIFLPAAVASGTLQQRMMPVMMEHMLKTAPAGADTKSWRY